MRFATIGPVPASSLGDELAKAKADFGELVRLGLAYYPIHANLAAIHAAWRAVFGAPLVGASTAGISFTERGASEHGVVVGLFGGHDVGIGVADGLKRGASASLAGAIKSAWSGQSRANAMLVLTDPFACDGEEVVTALRSNLPVHARAFGAAAGDDDRFVKVKLLSDRRALSDAAIFVAIAFPKPVALEVRHGFSRVDGARAMHVTGSADTRITTLDGEPAAQAYQDELRRLNLLDPQEAPILSMARHSLGIVTPFGEGLIIRTPIRILADGAVQLTSAIPTGQQVTLVTTSREQMLAAAHTLRKHTFAGVSDASGALVFDCGGRRARLGAEFKAEIAALSAGAHVPMLGFTGYGEIAKFGGNVHGFHNITAVMAGF
jgi:hypothetical protein